MISRILASNIEKSISELHKAVILYGPRQAGKTTLISAILEKNSAEVLKFTGDDLRAQEILSRNDLEKLKPIIGLAKLLVIDEAQRIENIGLTIKLLIDNLPITVLASGSASFDLSNKISEPLTGRTKTFWLYPLAYAEIREKYRLARNEDALENMLLYGMYPQVHNLESEQEKQEYLFEYLNNYLYKDIMTFSDVRKPKKVMDLLALLALQIGKEVSIAELAQNLAISQLTVQKYLDILEKMFVVINLRGFSRNLRKEISKTSKYYFVDTGIRNAVIRNFNKFSLRSDAGDLFENWFIMEKIKKSANQREFPNFYFWRTYDQQEIDLIEENKGKLIGYECKFSAKKEVRAPKDWVKAYPNEEFKSINSEDYGNYL